jgi:hypothetical protein
MRSRSRSSTGSRDGRGLADMRAAAGATGGAVAVSFGSGAQVQAAWPAVCRPT